VTLPSGFAAQGVGAGALCMTCHNTRNGLHEDPITLTSFSAPHTPSQADILMGRNAYFMSGYNISMHAAISDTCVTCHVKITPADPTQIGLPANYNFKSNNHTFRASLSICGACHSPDVSGTATQAEFDMALGDVGTLAATKLLALLNNQVGGGGPGTYDVIAYNPATDKNSSAAIQVSLVPPSAAGIDFATEIHGAMSVHLVLPPTGIASITWSDSTVSTNVTDLYFQLGSLKSSADHTTLLIAANSIFTKGLWNWYLVKGDGSKAIHNPSFVFDILGATKAQLGTL
jgi:hypothetical protein